MDIVAPTPVEVISDALYAAAECYWEGNAERGDDHRKRADNAMARHGITPVLRTDVQTVGAFVSLGLLDRASEVAENIADSVEALYA